MEKLSTILTMSSSMNTPQENVYDTVVQGRPCAQTEQNNSRPQNPELGYNNFDDMQFLLLNNMTQEEYNKFINNYHILQRYK